MQKRKWKNFSIDIFGTTWKIVFKDQVLNKFDNNSWTFGISHGYSRYIEISKRDRENQPIPDKEIEDTLVHELIHAVLDTMQLLQESSNEVMVEILSKFFLSLIRNNTLSKAYEKER